MKEREREREREDGAAKGRERERSRGMREDGGDDRERGAVVHCSGNATVPGRGLKKRLGFRDLRVFFF